jgi:hypothetical protein
MICGHGCPNPAAYGLNVDDPEWTSIYACADHLPETVDSLLINYEQVDIFNAEPT